MVLRTLRWIVGPLAVAISLSMLPGISAADGNKKFVCNISPSSDSGLSGTYYDVIVPANGFCLLNGATVTHDVIAQQNSLLAVANTTIGHDLSATSPQEIATGAFAGTPGPVSVGHDLSISGSDGSNGIGYDICDTRIQHDLSITGTTSFDEIDVGDTGTESLCTGAVSAPDSVGHDAIVSNNSPARLDIGDNTVGHDLIVVGNQATGADGGPASIDVSDNHVGHDATCHADNPAPAGDGPEDGPNSAGHSNSCG
jgi:hypothetical protein